MNLVESKQKGVTISKLQPKIFFYLFLFPMSQSNVEEILRGKMVALINID